MNQATQIIKAVISLLPMLAMLIPALRNNIKILMFLPTLIPLFDEVEDLSESGGLTRQNMEEAVLRVFESYKVINANAMKVDQVDVTELAGVMFEKIKKIVDDLNT